MTRSLGLVALLGLACSGGKQQPPPQETVSPTPEAPTPPPPSEPSPPSEELLWPEGCLLQSAAIHPSQPWLAVSCTAHEPETGAVMVFDVQRGVLRQVTHLEGYVGFSEGRLLQWHPDGERIATNTDTNGVALLRQGVLVGKVHPDQTRDTGVHFVWVGDDLYMDTGDLLQIQPGDQRFDFEYDPAVPHLQGVAWNTVRQAVVGRVPKGGIVAWDPRLREEVYRAPLTDYRTNLQCAPDGEWCAGALFDTPSQGRVLLFDASAGQVHRVVTTASPVVERLYWSPTHSLAVISYVHQVGGSRRVQMLNWYKDGEPKGQVDMQERSVQRYPPFDDVGSLSWSPSEEQLALLWEDQTVQVLDLDTQTWGQAFSAPAPDVPAGLPDWYGAPGKPEAKQRGGIVWVGGRLVRVGEHFVGVYSLEGEVVGEFVVR